MLQACYGVLHCSLASTSSNSPEELEDTSTRDTAELTVPPDGRSYEEYDAIVVSVKPMSLRSVLCVSRRSLTHKPTHPRMTPLSRRWERKRTSQSRLCRPNLLSWTPRVGDIVGSSRRLSKPKFAFHRGDTKKQKTLVHYLWGCGSCLFLWLNTNCGF